MREVVPTPIIEFIVQYQIGRNEEWLYVKYHGRTTNGPEGYASITDALSVALNVKQQFEDAFSKDDFRYRVVAIQRDANDNCIMI